LVLALGAALVLEHLFGRSTAGEGPRPPAKVADANLLPPFRLQPDPMAGAQALERPLFVPSRRPAPPAEAGGGAMKKGRFVLQGTTVVGPLSIAFLKEVSTGAVHRIEKGGEFQGMTVAEVAPQQVVLRAGGDSETLLLLVAKTAGKDAVAVERGPFEPLPGGATQASASVGPGTVTPAPAGAPTSPAAAAAARARVAPGSMAPLPQGAGQPAASPSSPMTPEEIISRRRAVRAQQQN
jgi:hypothetical protein